MARRLRAETLQPRSVTGNHIPPGGIPLPYARRPLIARKADGIPPPLVQAQPPEQSGGRSWVYPIGTGGVNRRPVYT